MGAKNATLSIMVGGTPVAFEKAKSILGTLGSSISHVGEPGAGQSVKAVNQDMVAGILASTSEALVPREKSGAEIEPAISAPSQGRAGVCIVFCKGPQRVE